MAKDDDKKPKQEVLRTPQNQALHTPEPRAVYSQGPGQIAKEQLSKIAETVSDARRRGTDSLPMPHGQERLQAAPQQAAPQPAATNTSAFGPSGFPGARSPALPAPGGNNTLTSLMRAAAPPDMSGANFQAAGIGPLPVRGAPGMMREIEGGNTRYTTPQGYAEFQGLPGAGMGEGYQRIAGPSNADYRGGTFSVLEGRSPEMQAAVERNVAQINRQTEALRALRTPARPIDERVNIIGQDGGFGILSNSHEAHRRAMIDAAEVSPGRRGDAYEQFLAGHRESMGLPLPSDRQAQYELQGNQQRLDAEQNQFAAQQAQRQAEFGYQQGQDYFDNQLALLGAEQAQGQLDMDRQRFAADKDEAARQQNPLDPRNIIGFALENLDEAKKTYDENSTLLSSKELENRTPFDPNNYVKERASLYLQQYGAMMDPQRGLIFTPQDILEYAQEQRITPDQAKERLRAQGLLG